MSARGTAFCPCCHWVDTILQAVESLFALPHRCPECGSDALDMLEFPPAQVRAIIRGEP